MPTLNSEMLATAMLKAAAKILKTKQLEVDFYAD